MTKIEVFTEDLTKELMGFSIGENPFGYVFPQGSVPTIAKIKNLLSKAGGKPKECELDDYAKGGAGKAKPEFIITLKIDPNTLIVLECKKSSRSHSSPDLNKPNGFAVDGALYYAKFLKESYNVIAIGVSGTDKDKALVDVYFWPKNLEAPIHQKKLHNIFLTPENYLRAINGEKITKSYSLDEIRDTAIDFHNKLRAIKVTEKHKPIFIAGILIALESEDFSRDYASLSSFSSVISALGNAIDVVLDDSDISKTKKDNIKASFKSIGQNEKLKLIPVGEDNSITWYIEQLEMKIKPMMNNADSSLDALGVFYHEFVKYSGGDGSGLGIVLTPQHLTEFMCELAEINEDSYVADICCGSGSFLVAAMNLMFKKTGDITKYENIRKHQLHGIELDQDLYVLAIANMIIRKDGKSNIIHGDCFNDKNIAELQKASKLRVDSKGIITEDNVGLTAGLLNPPYSQKKDKKELEFVEKLLDILVIGSKAAVVVPMSCAIGTKFKKERKRLFEKHTLKAVFSMPDDIFYPTGTNVCVMVWEAKKPHNPQIKTFFGYFKNDGFVKRKKIGRVDVSNSWDAIKNNWLLTYRNSSEAIGVSIKKEVKHNEEWLCEAYMVTDFNSLKTSLFERKIRNHLGYLVCNGLTKLGNAYEKGDVIYSEIDTSTWIYFKVTDIFNFKRGTRLTKDDRISGDIPLVTAGEGNAGVKELISNDDQIIFSNAITIDMFCNSYVHTDQFCCDDNILVLTSKKPISRYVMLFISTVIEMEKYRYQYGRQYRQKNLKEHYLKLPVTKDGEPDYAFMDAFIKKLPYAEKI